MTTTALSRSEQLKRELAEQQKAAREAAAKLRKEIEARERKELADRKAEVGRLAAHVGALGLTNEEIAGALAVALEVKNVGADVEAAALAARFQRTGSDRLAAPASKKPFAGDVPASKRNTANGAARLTVAPAANGAAGAI